MAKKKILIVDEDAGVRETLSGIFEYERYTAFTAKTGSNALKLLKTKSIDLIFLDIHLLDILENVIINEQSPPVILTGKKVTPEIVPEALRKGAVDFLEKPLSLEKLLVLAKRAIKSNVPKQNSLLT
ncbi:response regulator MprA [bacterium BMS3Bbin08]|nr:response regulator MprA [bacterium BMS3Bbin08]